jgi:hypothetical protein
MEDSQPELEPALTRQSIMRSLRLISRYRVVAFAFWASSSLCVDFHAAGAEPGPPDPSLVLHYRFDSDPKGIARDLSGHGNDGRIGGGAKYLESVAGRQGILRFNGETSFLDIGNPPSLQFGGDLSFEIWMRLNRPLDQKQDIEAYLFGEYPTINRLRFGWKFYDNLLAAYGSTEQANFIPIDRRAIGQEWVHVAVVFEYPRMRFFCNGKLIRDQFMPFPGAPSLPAAKFLGGEPPGGVEGKPLRAGNHPPVDIAEFSLYRRALTAKEILGHATGKAVAVTSDLDLSLEPDWYAHQLTVRLTSKGRNLAGRSVDLQVSTDGKAPIPAHLPLVDVSGNASGRFAASSVFPLAGVEQAKVKAVAEVAGPDGFEITQDRLVEKPHWIHSRAGLSDSVPSPWTAVTVKSQGSHSTQVGVSGREYIFAGAFPSQITARGSNLLTAPVTLTGTVNSTPINWTEGASDISQKSPKTVRLTHTRESRDLSLRVETTLDFDGYTIFDCAVTARQSVALDRLHLDIPLRKEHAALCAAAYVYEAKPGISMSECYWNAVNGDLNFRFSPSVWLGDNERGLTWQAETDQDWRNTDRQKAIQILQHAETTLFRANFVDRPTTLSAGQTLHYKFALLATPVKPMLRDAWDLRIMRSGPYGKDLDLPDMEIGGKPQLQYLADVGVKRLFWYVATANWPWPSPGNPKMEAAIGRLNTAVHEAGLQAYPYLIHHRFPIGVDEFNLYGRNIIQEPLKTSAWGASVPNLANSARPGPYSAIRNTQIVVEFCPKSAAAQDAYVDSLNERLIHSQDDGVYLDGTAQVMPCSNMEHGCGYRDAEGKIHATYPVFACREFIQRIYVTVKANKPDGVVDLHYWHPNPAQAAYADITFMGEQWHQLKGIGTDYIAGELPLDRFRSMFMGYQVGTPVDLMSYRLGSTMRLAAISLLHDVPVRLNQGGNGLLQLAGSAEGPAKEEREDSRYFRLLTKLWKIRDEFGAKDAAKYFYWANESYVQVAPQQCYATLFAHPRNGVLAIVANLSRASAPVTVRFDLDALKLKGRECDVFDALTERPLAMKPDGSVSISLGSEQWTYIWLKPRGARKNS